MQKMKQMYEKNTPEEIIDYRDAAIDADNKYRQRKGAVAEDPEKAAPFKFAGSQDIGDISYKTNWQSIVRDQLGISLPINQFYKCPVCGTEHCTNFPPERCSTCGCYNFLHQKSLIDLRK